MNFQFQRFSNFKTWSPHFHTYCRLSTDYSVQLMPCSTFQHEWSTGINSGSRKENASEIFRSCNIKESFWKDRELNSEHLLKHPDLFCKVRLLIYIYDQFDVIMNRSPVQLFSETTWAIMMKVMHSEMEWSEVLQCGEVRIWEHLAAATTSWMKGLIHCRRSWIFRKMSSFS